jgi:hypothetical protein
VDGGDEVLWAYDAFDGRPRLVLYAGDYTGGSVRLTAKAALGVPFEFTVVKWGDECCESTPPPSPARSNAAFEGAEVGPVVPTARGFERVDAASEEMVETGAGGAASITFDTPGWHRIKATALTAGKETAIRSNRLDVCVPPVPATDCGPLPSDDQVRTPPPSDLEEEPEPQEPKREPEDPAGNGSEPVARPPAGLPPAEQVRIALRGFDRSKVESGIVGVSWRVQDEGAGVSRWTVSSKRLGRKAARFVTRATGRAKSSAQLRLPAGGRYLLRLTFVDQLGQRSSVNLGTVRIPG